MRHLLDIGKEKSFVRYEFNCEGKVQSLDAEFSGAPQELTVGSVEEFITEHYWGYARQRDGGTVEYRVEHPRWRVWAPVSSSMNIDVTAAYGKELGVCLQGEPRSALLAEGSSVIVNSGERIK